MNTPIDLAAYRRPAEPEEQSDDEPWTLQYHIDGRDGYLGILAEVGERIVCLERRVQALERRGRL